MWVKEQIIQQVSTEQCSGAYVLMSGLAGSKTEGTVLFASQVFLFYLRFALRAHDSPPPLRAPPSHNTAAKFDRLDPFPVGSAPGNTVGTLMSLMSTVTLQPSLLPWHTKLSHFLPEINHFPGWLTVGTFISFREKHSFYPLGVILSPRSQKTATKEPAIGTFHKVWAVQSHSWQICSAM